MHICMCMRAYACILYCWFPSANKSSNVGPLGAELLEQKMILTSLMIWLVSLMIPTYDPSVHFSVIFDALVSLLV